MPTIIPRRNESIDSVLKRFKKAVERSGVLSDLRKHEFYEKPSVKRKRKAAAARKRALKRQVKMGGRVKPKNKNFRWNKDRTQKIQLNTKPQDKSTNTNTSGQNNRRPNSNFKKFNKKPNYNKQQGKKK